MNGTFVITYRTTSFGDRVPSQPLKLDGRKSLKNLISEAVELTRKVGDDSFKLVKMKGGDWIQPLEDFPFYTIL